MMFYMTIEEMLEYTTRKIHLKMLVDKVPFTLIGKYTEGEDIIILEAETKIPRHIETKIIKIPDYSLDQEGFRNAVLDYIITDEGEDFVKKCKEKAKKEYQED